MRCSGSRPGRPARRQREPTDGSPWSSTPIATPGQVPPSECGGSTRRGASCPVLPGGPATMRSAPPPHGPALPTGRGRAPRAGRRGRHPDTWQPPGPGGRHARRRSNHHSAIDRPSLRSSGRFSCSSSSSGPTSEACRADRSQRSICGKPAITAAIPDGCCPQWADAFEAHLPSQLRGAWIRPSAEHRGEHLDAVDEPRARTRHPRRPVDRPQLTAAPRRRGGQRLRWLE